MERKALSAGRMSLARLVNHPKRLTSLYTGTRDLVEDGVKGISAITPEEWEEKLPS
jgi:hypothetical protein